MYLELGQNMEACACVCVCVCVYVTQHTQNLTFRGPCIMIYSYKKPKRYTNLPIYFLKQNSTCFGQVFVHHQESNTVHTTIGICHTVYADCLLPGSEWNYINCMTHTYCCVYSARLLMMDRETV
jgi:hypothetical protein